MDSAAVLVNGFNGKCISRQALQDAARLAREQEQTAIASCIDALLADNPNDQKFKVKISAPAIEVVPESFLRCLECENDTDGNIVGLGKPVSPNQIYDMITTRMIQLVKEANAKDYVQKWSAKARQYGTGYLIPYNFVSKKPYRGINRFLLAGFKPMANPFYMTFKQVEELGGKVKQGSHGHEVIYFTLLYRYEQAEPKLEYSTYDRQKFIGWLNANRDKIGALQAGLSPEMLASQSYLPILKYYNVFNGADIEGIDFKLDSFKAGYIEKEAPAVEDNRMPVAEAIAKYYPQKQPSIAHGGQRAYYTPATDHVQMPKFTDFDTAQDYYRTFFHELAHSTGHGSRLGRTLKGHSQDRKAYAFEELIAEFAATFLSAEAGILWHTNKNHAAYLKSWNSALVYLEEDNRFLMRAATQGQAAADFVLSLDSDGQPAYIKELKAVIEKPVKKKKAVKKVTAPAEPAQVEFVLNSMPDKYNKAIYNSAQQELTRYANTSEAPLNVAAQNMLYLIKENLFSLQYFSDGYGRNNSKPEYRNVPTVWRKLTTDDIKALSPDVRDYLLEKLEEYQYETAWQSYDFGGKKSTEIFTIVKANIRLLEKKAQIAKKPDTSQLELQLNGRKTAALNAPTPQPIAVIETEETVTDPAPEEIAVVEPVEVKPQPVRNVEPVKKGEVRPGSIAYRKQQMANQVREYYTIADAELAKFLGNIEKKQRESVVITIAAPQGSGKSRFLFRCMEAFGQNYKCGHASMEEHPLSSLYEDKANQYLSDYVQNTLANPDINNFEDLEKLIAENEITFIDSWAKVQEMRKITLDKDLRKKYDGKLFVIIYQLTTDGKMRGGSDSQFDGDIILMGEKSQDYRENKIITDKNRYHNIPACDLKFNIYTGKMVTDTDNKVDAQQPAPMASNPAVGVLKFL